MEEPAKTTAVDDARKLAQLIANRLFTNGMGEEAHRLVLELTGKRDGGGWCKQAVVDQIEDALQAQLSDQRTTIERLERELRQERDASARKYSDYRTEAAKEYDRYEAQVDELQATVGQLRTTPPHPIGSQCHIEPPYVEELRQQVAQLQAERDHCDRHHASIRSLEQRWLEKGEQVTKLEAENEVYRKSVIWPPDYERALAEIARLQATVGQLTAEIQDLEAEVKRLRDDG